jgi:hypothetical protein
MPVAQILCEGGNNSPDVRLLSRLLAGICEVKPLGGKYGMGTRILVRREVLGPGSVYGILDGDFVKEWSEPRGKPREWKSGDGIFFGWRWERKEIENYLIDPMVVEKALGAEAPDISEYCKALESAASRIAVYQAARIALSMHRPRFKDMPSGFGPVRGKEKHPFPEELDKIACEVGIRAIVARHQEIQMVSLEDIERSFESLVPQCEGGGERNRHYLHAFAGKDLFWSMNQWFSHEGYGGAWVFREKVLSGIQKTADDIASWLPEWSVLKNMVSEL